MLFCGRYLSDCGRSAQTERLYHCQRKKLYQEAEKKRLSKPSSDRGSAELDSQMCYKKDAGQLEAVEKATKQYADVIAGVDKKMLELRKKIQKM